MDGRGRRVDMLWMKAEGGRGAAGTAERRSRKAEVEGQAGGRRAGGRAGTRAGTYDGEVLDR
jgi:hypothetical protein